MHQFQHTIIVQTQGPCLTEITDEVGQWISESGIRDGLLTLLCRHTSASLLINENAAPEVRGDLVRWLQKLAPEGSHYAHDDEGPDDMPAHLKAALTGVNLTIPVAGGRMRLGTWQGIYLAEHRARPHRREIALHLLGE